jgi:hypothetical protein
LIDEAFESGAQPGDQIIGRAGDVIPKPVGLEPQSQPFDGIEVRRIARQKLRFKVMPVQSGSLVP